MITLPYTSRDYNTVFNSVKEIMQTLEPRADIDFDKANVESIIAKVIAGCVDSLSYNQDANILEAFPSTARDPRAVFDLLSIVGYTPKTARCCHVTMSLWNPSFVGEYNYAPFNSISLDGRVFYNPDSFRCAQGITTSTNWYQGTLKSPDKRTKTNTKIESFIDNYYPNVSTNVIYNNQYKLPESDLKIDSRTIRIYTEDGKQLTYVDNPYLTNITKSSFGILPSVNTKGYSLMFSKDVSSGSAGDNFYLFYLVSDGYNISDNLIPDFGGLAVDDVTPSFSYTYSSEASHDTETANEARNNIAYEFGWRDTPKTIVTKYDAERAVLQNYDFISAVDVRDGNDYSKCKPDLFDIQVFCKVNEEIELKLNTAVADGIKNRILTHFNKFKILPLNISIHIDDVVTEEDENVTELYYWYPDITIYLKEQVDAKGAAAIINTINEALFNEFSTINIDFNQVPRIVDIIETVQNASDMVLYLDFDGLSFMNKDGKAVKKTDVTCYYVDDILTQTSLYYRIELNTKARTRNIMYNSVKIVTDSNDVIAYDNGDGVIMGYGPYLDGYGTIDYKTGILEFNLNAVSLADNLNLKVAYKQETPTFCEFIDVKNAIKIATESLKP